MPANERFLDSVLTETQRVKTDSITPASSWSRSSKTLGNATSAFFTELENAGVVWAGAKSSVHLDNKKNKTKYTMDIAIAIALFKYGINRYTSTHPNDGFLYQHIMSQVLVYKIEKEDEQQAFLSALISILNETKELSDPIALMKDLQTFTAVFFAQFSKPDEAFSKLIKTKIFLDQFISKLKTEHTELFNDPQMINVFAGDYANGLLIISAVMKKDAGIEYNDKIFTFWIHLLKNNLLQATCAPHDLNLMQYWLNWNQQYYRVIHSVPLSEYYATFQILKAYINTDSTYSLPMPVYADDKHVDHHIDNAAKSLNTLIDSHLFDELTPTIRAQLFSLSYFTDPHSKRLITPLQVLAVFYVNRVYDVIVERLIIHLLGNHPTLSIANETGDTWIEILQTRINKDACARIIEQMPQQMKQELRDRGIPLLLDKKLNQRLQTIDFWTQPLKEKLSETHYNLCQTVKALALPEAFDANTETMRASMAYEKNYQSLEVVSKSLHWAEPPASPTFFNANPIAEFAQKIVYLRFSNGTHNDFLKTYDITNTVLYCVKLALDPQAQMPILNDKKLTSNTMDEHFKNEIKQSIEKSLIYFATRFVFHSDQKKMMNHFIALMNNINNIFEAYGLTFDDIIAKHPPSISILKNIYLTLYVFDEGQLQQTILYSVIKEDVDIAGLTLKAEIQNLPNSFAHFHGDLSAAAQTYKTGSLTARANFNKAGNELNRHCVNSILESVKDTGNPLILAVKLLLNIIDYRISSYMHSEKKYEKGFYLDHLNTKWLITYPDDKMATSLQNFKPLFIAQINMSLKRIEWDLLSKDIYREESLKRYLSILLNYHQVGAQDLKKLDDHAQFLCDYLDSSNNIARLIYFGPTDDKKWIAGIIKKHRDGINLTIEDVKRIIDLLSSIDNATHQAAYFEIPFVKAALAFKNDQYDATDIYLEKVYSHNILDYSTFTRLWALCLKHGLTDKIEFNNKPFMFYYLNKQGYGSRNDIMHLSQAILSKMVNTSYAYSYTGRFALPGYKDSKIVKLNEKQHKHITSNTFSPAVWSAFYHTKPPTDSFTVIEHLVIDLLVPNSGMTNLILISKLLKAKLIKHVDVKHPYGTWLEILFVGMHQASHEQKDFVIKCIFPYIPDETLNEIITTPQIRDRIAHNLLTQMDTFSDYYDNDDMKTYELYMRLLLQASIKFSAHLTKAEDFITQFCKILLKFSTHTNVHDIFEVNYTNFGDLKEIINDKIQTVLDDDPLIPSINKMMMHRTMGIKNDIENNPDNDQDANISSVEQVCVFIKNALFLPLSVFTSTENKDISQFLAQFSKKFTDKMKEAVYASSQKSIAYLFLYAPHKWYNFEFRVGILDLLGKLAKKLELDHKKLLPEETNVLTAHYLLGITKEKAGLSSKLPALPDSFVFTSKEVCVSDEQMPLLDQFVTKVIQNARSYVASFSNTVFASPDAMTMNFTKLIAALKYEGSPDEKKEIFMQALLCIIAFRLASYHNPDYEKALFNTAFKEPLLALKGKLQLSSLHKTQIFYEMVARLESMSASNDSNEAYKRDESLKETLILFIDVFDIEQFKYFDFKKCPATAKMNTITAATTAMAIAQGPSYTTNNNTTVSVKNANNSNGIKTVMPTPL